MAVLTLKTRRRSSKAVAELRQRVQERATRLVEAGATTSEPLLVVYGEQGASIYYEGGPRAAPRPA